MSKSIGEKKSKPISKQTNEPIYVKMFGKFIISHHGAELSESKIKTKQLVTLLSHMIYHRDKHLYLDNIYNVLWPEENSDNPAHALRNLVYRVRNILKENLDGDTSYILTAENNSYCWNNENDLVCDVTQFESYINAASDSNAGREERIENYLKAYALYEGDFMAGLESKEWVIPIATYYKHMYDKAIMSVTELLFEDRRYEDALKICLKATEIDPYNEKIHQNIIYIYNRLNHIELAIKHYQYISNMFDKELCTELSKETTNLYKKIAAKGLIEMDLKTIKETLSENDNYDIPLFCDYDSLKSIYGLQIRKLERKNESHFLLLLTLITKDGKTPGKPLLYDDMNKLANILKYCLRKSDIVANYSESQFLLMLGLLTYENAEEVKKRIEQEFAKDCRQTAISYSILAIN